MSQEALQVVQLFLTVIIAPMLGWVLLEVVRIGKRIESLDTWRETITDRMKSIEEACGKCRRFRKGDRDVD